jgi:hypothetical protein
VVFTFGNVTPAGSDFAVYGVGPVVKILAVILQPGGGPDRREGRLKKKARPSRRRVREGRRSKRPRSLKMRYVYFVSYYGKVGPGFFAHAQPLYGNMELVVNRPIDSMEAVRAVEQSIRDQLAAEHSRLLPESLAIMGFTLLHQEQ